MIFLSYLSLLLAFFATNSAKIVRGGLPHAKKTNTWVANGRQEIPSGLGSSDPGNTASATVQDATSYDKGKSESEKNSDEKNLDINVFLPKKKRFDEGFSMPLQHGNGLPVPVDGGSFAMPMINELSRALERQQMSQEMSHMSHAISQTMVDALLLAGKHDDHGHHIEEIFHHDDDDHHHHHHDDHDDHHYDHGLTLHDLEYAFDHFPHHDGVKEDEIVRALKSAFHSVIKEVRDKKKGDQTIVQAIPETQSAPETETEVVEAPPAPEAPTPPPAQPAADIVAAAAPPPPPPPTVVSAPPPPPPPPPIISTPPPPPPPPPIVSAPPPPPPPPPIISAPPPPPPPPPIISAPPPPPPPPPIISSPPSSPPPPPVISAPPPVAVPPPVIAAPAATQPAALPSVATQPSPLAASAAQPAGNVVANSPAALPLASAGTIPGAVAGGPQAGALQQGALQPGSLQAGAPQAGGQQAGVQQAGVPQAGVPQAGDQDPHHAAGVSDSHTTGGGPQTSQAAGQPTQPNAAQTAPPAQQPGTTSSTEPTAANQAASPQQQTPSVSQGQPGAIKDFKEGSKGYKILGDILAQAMLKAEKKLERGMQGAVMESERNKKIVQEHTANDNSNKEISDDDTTFRSSEEGDNIDENGGTYGGEHNGDTAEEGSAQWHDEAIEPNNQNGKDLSYSYERHHNPSGIKVAEPRRRLKGKPSKILRNGLRKKTAKKTSTSSLKDEKRKMKAYRASTLIRRKTKQKAISKSNNGEKYNEDEETLEENND